MKVLVSGDTHGSYDHMRHLIRVAIENKCECIVQVGDFGYIWKSLDDLDAVETMLAETSNNICLFWLDGNHENYSMMGSLGIGPNDETMTQVRPHIVYLPRGVRFHLAPVDCMAFGGAVSVDRNSRWQGRSWWPEETIKTHQVDRVITNPRPVDVLFTHDAPDRVPEMDEHLRRLDEYDPYRWPADAIRDSEWNRKLLGEVVDAVRPRVLFHGHMHHRYDGTRPCSSVQAGLTKIVGLGCDPSDSWVVLDTEDLSSVGAR